jgi:threonine/homoserine/homoserine lactone efflux protein
MSGWPASRAFSSTRLASRRTGPPMLGPMNLAFLVTSLVIVVTPGTGALLAISAGLSRGIRASVVTAFGCTLGIVPHLAAAITGTAALLRASGIAFETVKFLGVAYLLFMAWTTWRDRSPLVVSDGLPPVRARRVIGGAILANLLNPKLTIFFFAFLPQFLGSGPQSQVPTMLMLSAVFMAMTFVVFALYGIFAASVRQHLIDRPRIVRRVRQVFAASFVGLGAKLATTVR